jgi:hypothetical protein
MADEETTNNSEETQEAQNTVETIDLEIGEDKFTIPKKFAEMLAEQQVEITNNYKKFNEEITRLKQQIENSSSKKGKSEASNMFEDENEDEDDLETLLFTNPKKALSMLRKAVKEDLSEDLKEFKSKQDETKQQEQFWNEFWSANPDLNRSEDEEFVRHIFNKNFNKFSNMSVDQVIKKLGDTSRQEFMRLANKFGKHKGEEDEDETSSLGPILSVGKKGKVAKKSDEFESLSAIIKQRKRDKFENRG